MFCLRSFNSLHIFWGAFHFIFPGGCWINHINVPHCSLRSEAFSGPVHEAGLSAIFAKIAGERLFSFGGADAGKLIFEYGLNCGRLAGRGGRCVPGIGIGGCVVLEQGLHIRERSVPGSDICGDAVLEWR